MASRARDDVLSSGVEIGMSDGIGSVGEGFELRNIGGGREEDGI